MKQAKCLKYCFESRGLFKLSIDEVFFTSLMTYDGHFDYNVKYSDGKFSYLSYLERH